ncbi:Candidapepsin [Arthrobotrys entomopaga]|nr:Candidapepsin [Arthrobotrys entomopaga]
MRWLLVFPLLVSTGLSRLVAREGSKIIRVPFSKERNPSSYVGKRDVHSKTALQKLDNKFFGKEFLFYANVTLGTPEQPLRLHIDTGSSDIWVETPGSLICDKANSTCGIGGLYNNASSSTYEYVNGGFDITYVDGQFASGDYARDVVHIGGVAVNNVQFGIGFNGTSEEGILGIGFEARQSGVSKGQSQYPGLITQMVNQNLINSRAYSIWLNDLRAEDGEILFGGIDTGKFQGTLTTIPLNKRLGLDYATDFIISLHGLTFTDGNQQTRVIMNDTQSLPALLDTGASFTYLPYDAANQLIQLVGAQNIEAYKGPAVNCSQRSIEGSVSFQFAGVSINVNLRDFIIDATDEPNPNNEILCYFGILGMPEGSVLTLGDTFLRAAYIVYDMDNEEISIGQTIFNSTATNILEIGAGPTAVPSVTRPNRVDPVAVTGTDTAGISTSNPNSTPGSPVSNFACIMAL